jgi:hypothetical protein
MRNLIITSLFALAIIAGALPVSAQTAYVYAVHGIPGPNGFPVDIAVDGACAVTGFTFGGVGGPLSLSAGPHTVNIYAANTASPCSGSPALSATPNLAAGNTYALVAHLTEGGSPTLSGFGIDLSKTGPGAGRFILHHTAAAPSVDVTVNRGDGGGKSPSATIPGFANGAQVGAEFRPGDWYATLSVGGAPVFGPTMLTLAPKTAQLVFAVGAYPDTFTYIVKVIPIM